MKIEKVFKKNMVPIFLSCNYRYFPYMYITLKSILNNISLNYYYDINILCSNLSEQQVEEVYLLVNNLSNISIRFWNLKKEMEEYNLFIGNEKGEVYLSIEAYFRIMIPELLSDDYSKVIYLDCDTLVETDLAELMKFDISQYMLAAVRDIADNERCRYDIDLKRYRDQILPNMKYTDYVNSGVLLINVKFFKNTFSEHELLKKAASKKWRKHDQDVLNVACQGKILLLPLKWNLIEYSKSEFLLNEEYQKAKENPCIIHFAARKPWNCSEVFFQEKFWSIAVTTPYCNSLINEFRENLVYESLKLEIVNGKMKILFLLRILLNYFKRGKK